MPTSPFWRLALGFLWREWCWSWNSSTLATSCKGLTHWKRLWCWEELGAEGEGDDRGWDGWMASPTGWPWVWVNSGRWWWTGRPCVLRFMGSQRVGHDWATELNWTEHHIDHNTAGVEKCLCSCNICYTGMNINFTLISFNLHKFCTHSNINRSLLISQLIRP